MKPSEVDWSVLRGSIALLVGALIAGGGLAAGAYYFNSGVAAAHAKESRRLASARGSYLTLDDERRLIDTYYPRYRALEARGIIGAERRLNWVETLRTAATKIKLPKLQYEIASRDVFKPDFPVKTGRYAVFASNMNLAIGLLHEEDLPALLAELILRCMKKDPAERFQSTREILAHLKSSLSQPS